MGVSTRWLGCEFPSVVNSDFNEGTICIFVSVSNKHPIAPRSMSIPLRDMSIMNASYRYSTPRMPAQSRLRYASKRRYRHIVGATLAVALELATLAVALELATLAVTLMMAILAVTLRLVILVVLSKYSRSVPKMQKAP